MSQSSPPSPTTLNGQSERSSPTSPTAISINSHLSHVPQTPSRLRHSFAPGSPSPEQLTTTILYGVSPEAEHASQSFLNDTVTVEEDGIHPSIHNDRLIAENLESTRVKGHIEEEHEHSAASENSRLLNDYDHVISNYDHGTFPTDTSSVSSGGYEETSREERRVNEGGDQPNGLLTRLRPYLAHMESWMGNSGYGNSSSGDESGKDRRRGRIPKSWRTYLPYYIPILKCEFYFDVKE